MNSIIGLLESVLIYFYKLTNNYGLAIILLSILIKIATIPLTQKQMISTRKMQELEPQRKKIQEKYKNDKEKMNQAILELWKENNINPAAGCLPLLIQFPILIGMFRMIANPVKLPLIEGFSPLFLGIDLTVIVSKLAMPVAVGAIIITGASTFLQQWIMMPDKSQKAMLFVMPAMMAWFSYRFPGGLILYWFINNILSLAHHLLIIKPGQKGALEKGK